MDGCRLGWMGGRAEGVRLVGWLVGWLVVGVLSVLFGCPVPPRPVGEVRPPTHGAKYVQYDTIYTVGTVPVQ